MSAIFHSYEAYERRVVRGEFDKVPVQHLKVARPFRRTFSYRLGSLLIRTGLKLTHQTNAGHALTTTTMAGR